VRGAIDRLRAAVGGARLVREPLRFAARELLGGPVVRLYRPRGIGYRVWVRHNYPGPGSSSYDILPLREIVVEHTYAPPPGVATALRREAAARVVDLGGHLGYFGAFILSELPRASLVSFEPEPSHAALLASCIEANELGSRWELVEACAHTADGTLPFAAGLSVRSHLAIDEADPTELPARDVFPYLEDVDLLKIDIEGAEWNILFDERFARVLPRAIVLEYHSIPGGADNPKRAARDALAGLGYTVVIPEGDTNPLDEPFWGRGLLWADRA
jgi:FkbM family methyltransferase